MYKDIINRQVKNSIPKGMSEKDYNKYISGLINSKNKIQFMEENKEIGKSIQKQWNKVTDEFKEELNQDIYVKKKPVTEDKTSYQKNSKKDYVKDTIAEKKENYKKNPETKKNVVSNNPKLNQEERNKIIKEIGLKETTSLENSIKSLDTRFKSLSTFHKAGILVAIGGTMAVVNKVTTPKDEREKKSLIKGTIVGTSIAGLGMYGLNYQANKIGENQKIVKSLKETSGINPSISKSLNKAEKEIYTKARESKFSHSLTSKNSEKMTKKIMGGTAIFIATTSIIDTAMKKKESHDVDKQIQKDEKRLKKNQKQAEKYRKGDMINLDLDAKNLALEMFDQRIGHYAMGNSKFNK